MKTFFLFYWWAILFASPTWAAEVVSPLTVPACCKKPLERAVPLPDRSIYQVESVWTNDTGRAVRLSDLRGKPQVVVMFFAKCAYACPVLVRDMQKIETALPESARPRVGFTLVSFDTERDTPKVLADYRKQHDLGSERWTLLRGRNDDVLELAALLGVKFKRDANGDFSHSNIITLLNAEGEIVQQQVGLAQDNRAIINAIEELLTPPPAELPSSRASRQP
jgi:protein SCO1/2